MDHTGTCHGRRPWVVGTVCVFSVAHLFRGIHSTSTRVPVGDRKGPGDPGPPAFRQPSGQPPDPTRDRSSDGLRQSLQPHGHGNLRSYTRNQDLPARGLIVAELQDLQDPPERVTKVAGSPALDVPMKSPRLQTGLLNAVSAHEPEREREGSLGPVAPESPGSTATTTVIESGTSSTLHFSILC